MKNKLLKIIMIMALPTIITACSSQKIAHENVDVDLLNTARVAISQATVQTRANQYRRSP